jgi:hypothetical protein
MAKHVRKPVKVGKYDKFIDWCLNECWRIQKHLQVTSIRVSMDKTPTKTKDDYAFEITCGHPYQWATMKWVEDAYNDWRKDKNKITSYLLHEMLHILIEPFEKIARNRFANSEQFNDAEEEIVDRLTNILRYGILKK